jgi:hypothetical protein
MGSPAIPTGTQSHVETTMEICEKSVEVVNYKHGLLRWLTR